MNLSAKLDPFKVGLFYCLPDRLASMSPQAEMDLDRFAISPKLFQTWSSVF